MSFWKDTIAGVSILTGLGGFVLAATGDLQFTTEFAAHATVLGVYAASRHASRDKHLSLKNRLSILPVLGVAAVLLPTRLALLVVSLLLVTGGLTLSLTTD